jgi:hypothetical protein
MSDHVIGVVQKISEKATRNGGTMFNVCLDTGQEDEWFGHGFDEPEFSEGDEIEFDVSYNGDYANVDVDTVVIVSAGSGGRGGNRNNRNGSSRGRTGQRNSKSSSSRGGNNRRSGAPASRGARKSGAGNAPADDTKMSKEDWAKKDKMIQVQAAQNTAIALVSAAVQADAVKLPAKQADRYDAFCALVDEEADRLHERYIELVEEAFSPKKNARSSRSNSHSSRHEGFDDDIPE